ncbi:LptA/OstA family protein [Pseudoroseicyclus tamaricis]|uniref:Lipopolysaccharide transport periplasmic protein LptA n=1 Tax=Pseudoroseicyclus tamaricis TaxID=2705421 RepID=A0A6B2K4Q4_9RHOB|nr:LptA/OstA family protein [Pseudoroseicyclus tamaricis]NDV02842.1 lipopolysaccharide transport periplasmic protein LptA [Pseudoroseicyclus tamaricis]
MRSTRLAAILCLALAGPAAAQSSFDLGQIDVDPSAQVEVTADSLEISQEDGTAVFSGNVVVGQGEMRISAGEVRVNYSDETGDITRLDLSGGVTFATPTEAAEAQAAEYDIGSQLLTLTGDVLLQQGQSAIGAERAVIDLGAGTARMEGQVRTVLGQTPGGGE